MYTCILSFRNESTIERYPYYSSASQFGFLHHHIPTGFQCMLTEIPAHLAANLPPVVNVSEQVMYQPVKLGAAENKLTPALKVWISTQ
jgi:hypothetical protein